MVIASRSDGTLPEQGWPWPWEDSCTTNYAYAFDDGKIWVSCFGRAWMTLPEAANTDLGDGPKVAVFPDMTGRQRVTFGPRSGLLALGLKGPRP
jgi:hypothetical protein